MPELAIPNLFARRSIRRFTAEPVSEEEVAVLLEAAMAAPSASNRRPWHFIVVTDAATRATLADTSPYAKMLAEAPLCLVPCGDPAISEHYWVQDLAAATENVLLAVVGLGLGAVWCGVHPREDRIEAARLALGIPDGIVPFAYLAIGRPAEDKEPRTQYDPERVHRERW
jgi:nitroreductase